jgi:hypothetical protein
MANLFDPSSIYLQLAQAGLLPQWAQQRPVTGAEGSYNPNQNKLVAVPAFDSLKKGTLAHETTHAAQFNLLFPAFHKISDKLKQGTKVSQAESQYYEAAKKLLNIQPQGAYSVEEGKANRDSLQRAVDSMYKSNADDSQYKAYRTQPLELQAFGVGNMSQGGMHAATQQKLFGSSYHPHLDPSFASEFDIIMSLYSKLPASLKEEASTKRKETIKTNTKSSEKDMNTKDTLYSYEDMNTDPFKSSIK